MASHDDFASFQLAMYRGSAPTLFGHSYRSMQKRLCWVFVAQLPAPAGWSNSMHWSLVSGSSQPRHFCATTGQYSPSTSTWSGAHAVSLGSTSGMAPGRTKLPNSAPWCEASSGSRSRCEEIFAAGRSAVPSAAPFVALVAFSALDRAEIVATATSVKSVPETTTVLLRRMDYPCPCDARTHGTPGGPRVVRVGSVRRAAGRGPSVSSKAILEPTAEEQSEHSKHRCRGLLAAGAE